ncbi:alanine racemase [Rhodospirillaceae bacterium KN72]|uniref:Alanine racemase n=1 Tax=Pacificispira spongiicola TaxID=2729598 RepID=A0A7Y0DZ49_9PROT|nr:alanine racemase [Pacificispira spongiicola]NMM44284.1 alanine racemase [Pacificispira spongiicola]
MSQAGFPHSPTTLTIDLDAIVQNWQFLCSRTGHGRSAAVVKANGYGLGLSPVARSLAAGGCKTFYVAHLDEGIALRQVLDKSDIRIGVLNGLLPGQEEVFLEHRLWPSLCDPGQIDRWAAFCRANSIPLPALLHIDTGMSRTGLDRTETADLIDNPDRLQGIDLRFVMSHMACADDPAHPMNREQQQRFADAVNRLPKATEGAMLAASSAIFLGSDWHFDWVRPGVCLYGVRPNTTAPNPMKPVVTLQSRILQVRQIDAPESVGYGASHRAEGPTRIATIAVGYADGFLRSLSNSASAWLGDIEVPLVGRVSMDLVTLDVTAVPTAQAGDTVTLIGPNQDVDAVADKAGTIGYEILTSLGARYARSYVGGVA